MFLYDAVCQRPTYAQNTKHILISNSMLEYIWLLPQTNTLYILYTERYLCGLLEPLDRKSIPEILLCVHINSIIEI